MSARDDYPELADEADRAWTPDHWPEEAKRALDEIDELRAWRTRTLAQSESEWAATQA